MSGRDCFDCEYAEYDVEEYFGGYREKIVIGCNSPDECTEDVECFRAGINTALNVIDKYKIEREDK